MTLIPGGDRDGTVRRAAVSALRLLAAAAFGSYVTWQLARWSRPRPRPAPTIERAPAAAVPVGTPAVVDTATPAGPAPTPWPVGPTGAAGTDEVRGDGATLLAALDIGPPVPRSNTLTPTQADRVSTMWGNIAADGGDTEPGLWGALLDNGSDAPIRYAHLTVRHRRDGWTSKGGFHKVAPHCRLKWAAVKVFANAAGGYGPPQLSRPRRGRRTWHDPTQFNLELTFQDFARRFWLLGDDDELHELNRELVIWLDNERLSTCERHIDIEFQPRYGVDVRFEPFITAEELQHGLNRFAVRPEPGRRPPDILVGAHDWLGRLAAQNAIVDVALTAEQRDAFDEKAIRALSRDGRLLGVPYSFDCVAVIANAELTRGAPAPRTVRELVEFGERFKRPGGRGVAMQIGPAGDMYHLWPIFSSAGGTMAGLQPDGDFLPRAQWEPGLASAYRALVELKATAPDLLDPDLTRDQARDLFLAGRTPYLIAACGRLGEALEHSMNVRTYRVPPLGPYPARSMITVMTFFVTRFGENQRIAQDLVTHYLARPDTGVVLNRVQPWPPVQREAAADSALLNPNLTAYLDALGDGLVMPSHPGMRPAWECLNDAQLRIARGYRDARSLAASVAEELDGLRLSERPGDPA